MRRLLPLVMSAALALAGCGPKSNGRVQGYVEGEFVYVASALAGTLEKLAVYRGQQVQQGAELFVLDSVPERAAYDEATRRLAQARANLADLQKGRRPEEIAAMEAQIAQARAALDFSQSEKARQEELLTRKVNSKQDLDRANSNWDQDRKHVTQLEADLQTARLGSRTDQIAAMEAEARAREAALTRAAWDLAQKAQKAPQAGLVFDTLYREGEWVQAGRPVVSLLPPQNIKVRAYISEERIASVHPGQAVKVWLDGVAQPAQGKVTFVSPQAEYTPPVIYSRETRGKLVFLIEARFDSGVAATLNPGQPLELELVP